MAASYERRKVESDAAWGAFVIYRDLGLDRTQAKTAGKLSKSVPLIARWSIRHQWRARVHAFDMEIDRRARVGALKGVEDMRRRQTRAAIAMQDLGTVELAKLTAAAKKATRANVISEELILKLIDGGAKLERLNRGEPGEITQHNTADALDLSLLSTEELKVIRNARIKIRAQQQAVSESESRPDGDDSE